MPLCGFQQENPQIKIQITKTECVEGKTLLKISLPNRATADNS